MATAALAYSLGADGLAVLAASGPDELIQQAALVKANEIAYGRIRDAVLGKKDRRG